MCMCAITLYHLIIFVYHPVCLKRSTNCRVDALLSPCTICHHAAVANHHHQISQSACNACHKIHCKGCVQNTSRLVDAVFASSQPHGMPFGLAVGICNYDLRLHTAGQLYKRHGTNSQTCSYLNECYAAVFLPLSNHHAFCSGCQERATGTVALPRHDPAAAAEGDEWAPPGTPYHRCPPAQCQGPPHR